ncbi:hypothetical protein ACFQRL_12600 [Microbacterium fluvii]|uniref:Uncharacterized protein n=1 Tax=Microbacterium fluvii TaxID=415215 RepID=A0ABW2HER3_9MICO|nr:hypothetical protein [Microbacterium fluvii]MCU4673434.1 hypothetical protein [Microbacterium fluvii]
MGGEPDPEGQRMVASVEWPVRTRPWEITVVAVLGYAQAALQTIVGLVLLTRLTDAAFVQRYDADSAAAAVGVYLIVAGLVAATVATGVLFGTSLMRWFMAFGLALGAASSVLTMLRGGMFVAVGIVHLCLVVIALVLLFSRQATLWIHRP